MLIELIHANITLVIIFTTIYSCGLGILKKINFNYSEDIFIKIIVGYTFIGTIAVIFHFFFKINNIFSILIISTSIIFFLTHYLKDYKKDFFIFVFLLVLISPILFAYSDHPIDSNMYHHPYISYLKAEKIVLGIANIQFRFGHVSFLQFVQAALVNDYLHSITLSSINIIIYLSFILFASKNILTQRKLSFSFLATILISGFVLIKLARYREFGNDLIPLLLCSYFFIKILDSVNKKTYYSSNALNVFIIFFTLMLVHKISYIFASLIFIAFFKFKNFEFLKNLKFSYVVICSLIIFPWLLKNYLETSCLIYPLEITCFSNKYFYLFGLADTSSAAWLTEIWAKGFIDHPDWRSLDLREYARGFNWVSTWMSGHFIKILEILTPLILLIILISISLIKNRKIYFVTKINHKEKTFYLNLFFLIFIGLFIWFYKAPIFRYGAFYIISFLIVGYLLLIMQFAKLTNSTKINYFKVIFMICIIFFITKNIFRINNSSKNFFPQTVNTKVEIKDIEGLIITRSKNSFSSLCFYTKYICSHELPKNFKIDKIKNYYIITR